MFRPVVVPGGRGARMTVRLQFPRTLVDDRTYDLAHTAQGVERVRAMGCNWALLVASWGFPPEIEDVDRRVFQRAVQLYQAAGIRVCGGVQVATCVAQGSYQERGWYALDPWGHRIPYDRDRFWTCWHDPEWSAEVERAIRDVIEAGADGVWFAGPWGLHTVCPDARCQPADGGKTGEPGDSPPGDTRPEMGQGEMIAQRVGAWAAYAREQRPDLLIAAQLDSSDSALDGEVWSQVQVAAPDLILLDGELPRLGSGWQMAQPVTVVGQKAPAARGIGAPTPRGENSDAPARRWLVGMAEACALGSVPVISAAGLRHAHTWTLLLAEVFEGQRQAIGHLNTWLEKQGGWLAGRQAFGPLAVLWPGRDSTRETALARESFEAACRTLIEHGLPLRVVGPEGDWAGVQTLIAPPGGGAGLDDRLRAWAAQGGRLIALQQARPGGDAAPVWAEFPTARRTRRRWSPFRRARYRLHLTTRRLYYTHDAARFLLRRLGWRPHSRAGTRQAIPSVDLQRELVEAVGCDFGPRAEADGPVLLTMWRGPHGGEQWHLVNYADAPQRVTLHAPQFVSGWVIAPEEREAVKVFGNELMVTVDVYKVLRLQEKHEAGAENPGLKH